MKKFLLLIFLAGFSSTAISGNIEGGEITYQKISGFTFQFQTTLYVKGSVFGWDSLLFYNGEGTSDTMILISDVPINPILHKLDFVSSHTYPGLGTYVVFFIEFNRFPGIKNINGGNSVNEPFYIEDTIFIRDPLLFPFDYSPSYTHWQTEVSFNGSIFTHNSEVVDSAADSVTYELIVPLKYNSISVANYVFPNETPGTPWGNTFILDSNGLIVWNSPVFTGNYSIAIRASLWKNGWKMGTMIRDMLIHIDEISSVNNSACNETTMSISPNPYPSSGILNISFSSPNYASAQIKIVDVLGRNLFSGEIESNHQLQIASEKFSASEMFFIELLEEGRLVDVKKLLVAKK